MNPAVQQIYSCKILHKEIIETNNSLVSLVFGLFSVVDDVFLMPTEEPGQSDLSLLCSNNAGHGSEQHAGRHQSQYPQIQQTSSETSSRQ